ncbi:MAG: hypothetical protein EOL97_10825 [Spirochaetia bacterium]|nr:hypothetical protein [Spirochaetia bacterium]
MRKDPLIIDKVKARYKYIFYKKYIYEEFVNSFEIKGDESILDFGCKFGYISYICSKKLDTGKISCIDFTSKWLLEAKKDYKILITSTSLFIISLTNLITINLI